MTAAIVATQMQLAAALTILDAGLAATTAERFEWAARYVQRDRETIIRVLTRPRGRSSAREGRIIDMVRTVRGIEAAGRRPTRELVAQQLGRAGPWPSEMPGDFKRDVQAAGGWAEVLRLAAG